MTYRFCCSISLSRGLLSRYEPMAHPDAITDNVIIYTYLTDFFYVPDLKNHLAIVYPSSAVTVHAFRNNTCPPSNKNSTNTNKIPYLSWIKKIVFETSTENRVNESTYVVNEPRTFNSNIVITTAETLVQT